MTPRRILVVDHAVDIGGAEVGLLRLLKRLDRMKFEPIFMVSSRGVLWEKLNKMQIETVVMKMCSLERTRSPLRLLLHVFHSLWTVAGLIYHIKKRGVSLIHTNSEKAHIFGCIAGKLSGIPVIPDYQDLPRNPKTRKLMSLLMRVTAKKVIVNSRAVADMFSQNGMNYGKVALVYPAVDLDEFNPSIGCLDVKRELGLLESYPVIGIIGQIIPWKGHREFLKAASIVKDVFPRPKFLIVGEVPSRHRQYKVELINQIRKLNLSHYAIFTGFRKDLTKTIAALDFLVLASWEEPFGAVLIEAMAMQKPVIGTNAGGVPEIINDGKNGCLVPPKDPESLAEAMLKIARNRKKARKMGLEGLSKVREEFTLQRRVRRFEEIFGECLAKR